MCELMKITTSPTSLSLSIRVISSYPCRMTLEKPDEQRKPRVKRLRPTNTKTDDILGALSKNVYNYIQKATKNAYAIHHTFFAQIEHGNRRVFKGKKHSVLVDHFYSHQKAFKERNFGCVHDRLVKLPLLMLDKRIGKKFRRQI